MEQSSGTCQGNAAAAYMPADVVPATGIYSLHHSRAHAGQQELLLFVNTIFPDCDICWAEVQFRLQQAAGYEV